MSNDKEVRWCPYCLEYVRVPAYMEGACPQCGHATRPPDSPSAKADRRQLIDEAKEAQER